MSYVRQASLIEKLMVGLVAAIHFIFALGEMFLWKPLLADRLLAGLTGETEEVRAPVLTYTGQFAFNMGLYNAFLAVGLVLALRDLGMRHNRALARLFLAFIVVAGRHVEVGAPLDGGKARPGGEVDQRLVAELAEGDRDEARLEAYRHGCSCSLSLLPCCQPSWRKPAAGGSPACPG